MRNGLCVALRPRGGICLVTSTSPLSGKCGYRDGQRKPCSRRWVPCLFVEKVSQGVSAFPLKAGSLHRARWRISCWLAVSRGIHSLSSLTRDCGVCSQPQPLTWVAEKTRELNLVMPLRHMVIRAGREEPLVPELLSGRCIHGLGVSQTQ